MKVISQFVAVLLIVITTGGCNHESQPLPQKRPRPVVTASLTEKLPPDASLVSASVGSWKTEEIGFEVGGRIEFVVEPNTEVEGRILDIDGNLIVEGTPIGRIESERFSLQVARAKAEVTRAEQNLIVARTELEESIPAQITAAQATLDLAETEFTRSQNLFDQQAGTKGSLDRDRANFKNAASQIKQLDATKNAKLAEIQSLENAILQAKQNLRDAERNLEDCTLYSSFRGQIAKTSVVPGSVVSAGQPAVNVQMMNPIKVELEVSAEDSKRLQQTEVLPVHLTMPDGSTKTLEGFLYLIDPTADPLTRTFTVTLLVMNEKLVSPESQNLIATTDQTWRLDFKFLPGAEEGKLFAADDAMQKDDQGDFLWQITDPTIDSRSPGDRLFKVRKLRVELGKIRMPFLGNWVFQEVIVNDEMFNPKKNLVCGKLSVSEGTADDWSGESVLLDSGSQWMLRPGDLVRVDSTGGVGVEGYYVPMDAIVWVENHAFIFVVQGSGKDATAKRVAVQLIKSTAQRNTSSLLRIAPMEGESFEGMKFIVNGTHYLVDGEPVVEVSRMEEVQ